MDISRFLLTCFSVSFASCQVNKVQFAFSVVFMTAGVGIDHFDPNGENGMRAEISL